jgi:hypothetical protein
VVKVDREKKLISVANMAAWGFGRLLNFILARARLIIASIASGPSALI